MKNIKGYIEHMTKAHAPEAYEGVLDYRTRDYIEKRVVPYMSMQPKELLDLIPQGWRPHIPIGGTPIRLRSDDVGILECIPMYGGKDVVVVRFSPKDHSPVEYFTREEGFAKSLTMSPEEDAEMLSRTCMEFTCSVARKLQKAARSRGAFGRF
jgi:hypothetical protein